MLRTLPTIYHILIEKKNFQQPVTDLSTQEFNDYKIADWNIRINALMFCWYALWPTVYHGCFTQNARITSTYYIEHCVVWYANIVVPLYLTSHPGIPTACQEKCLWLRDSDSSTPNGVTSIHIIDMICCNDNPMTGVVFDRHRLVIISSPGMVLERICVGRADAWDHGRLIVLCIILYLF